MATELSLFGVKPARVRIDVGLGLVLCATFGLSLKGIWARLAYAEGASVETVLFYRATLSLPLIFVCARWFSRLENGGQSNVRWSRSHVLWGACMGAFFSVGMFCDFQSIYYLGAGVSRVVLFGYPLVVLILEAATQRRRPTSQRLAGFTIAWFGLVLVCGLLENGSGHSQSSTRTQWQSLSWGAASLVLYACYVFLSGKLSQKMGASRLSLLSNLSTSVIVMSVLLFRTSFVVPQISAKGAVWLVLMVTLSTVVPYFLMMEGIRRLGATRASLSSMIGPVITLAVSAVVLGEGLSQLQLSGAALTLLGVMWVQGHTPLTVEGRAKPSIKIHQ